MPAPPLLELDSVKEYRDYYERQYCRGTIITADGIRVYFRPQKFGHAFYENSQRRKGPKDEFSFVRAQRMSWIRLTLEHPDAQLYMGWNKDARNFEEDRRLSVVYEDFVVIIELSIDFKGSLKANFVTCYQADQSMAKIRQSPPWDKEKCLAKLKQKGCR